MFQTYKVSQGIASGKKYQLECVKALLEIITRLRKLTLKMKNFRQIKKQEIMDRNLKLTSIINPKLKLTNLILNLMMICFSMEGLPQVKLEIKTTLKD
jgi:DNA polymerase II large subunit